MKQSGFSHFIEHLVFKSTSGFPNNDLTRQVTNIGGLINAYTEYDTTCYYLSLPDKQMAFGLDVISEIAYKANFTAEDVRIEKDIISEEIKQYDNEPESEFIDWIQSTFFIKNPLKKPILGNIKSVKTAQLSSLRQYYRKYYTPNNSFLVITGNFNPSNLYEDLSDRFGNWISERDQQQTVLKATPECSGFRFFDRVTKSSSDYIAFIIPELQDKDELSDSMLILARIFASGRQSRLYKRLVEIDKLAVDIKLYSVSGLYPGITIIQVVPINSLVVQDIIYAYYDELVKFMQNCPSISEIDLVKKELLYAWQYDFEYVESIASALANAEISGNYQRLYDFPAQIAKVDYQMLVKCLKTYWKSDYMAVYHQGKYKIPDNIVKIIQDLFKGTNLLNSENNALVQTIQCGLFDQTFVSNFAFHNEFRTEYRELSLDSGIPLLVRRIPTKPTVSVSITAPISQLNEPMHLHGINYMTSSMLLYGTHKRSYDDLQKFCLTNGITLKVSHTLETTTIKGKCIRTNVELLLQVLGEVLNHPSYPRVYLGQFKDRVVDSIKQEYDSPLCHAYNQWANLIFGKVNNLNKPYGNITQVRAIKLNQLLNWHASFYSLRNFNVSIAGNVEFDEVYELCGKNLCGNQRSALLPPLNCIVSESGQRYKVKRTEKNQSNIIIGGYGSPANDQRINTAFMVLSQILGGELSSRFFTILREKYGYIYQSGFDFTSTSKLGFWVAYAICDKSDHQEVYRLILDIFNDIKSNGVTQEELDRAKNYLKAMHIYDMESVSWQSSTISILKALGYDYDYFMNRENRIDNVDRDDIVSIFEQFMRPDDIYTYLEN